MLNGVFQRPYVVKDGRGPVKKKQEEDQTAQTGREEQSGSNSKSKGLQYVEPQKPTYTPAYQQAKTGFEEPDWRQTRSLIQNQVQTKAMPQSSPSMQEAVQAQEVAETNSAILQKSSQINIAQIIKDFKNTAKAIGTPENLSDEVNGYLTLIESQVQKETPNVRLIKSNLKNASSILDGFISETLNKESKVVENWVDALFLQKIDFKYNEGEINPQFLVKFPDGSTKKAEKVETKTVVNESVPETIEEKIVKAENQNVQSLVPQDKELKSLFIQSKKLAYANEPKKAIVAFQKALERANEVGDKETQSKIFYEVGRIYDDHDYFAQALKSYNKSIENTTDNHVKTKAHYSMAQIYDDVNQVTPAMDHYFNSISFAGEADNLVAQSTSLTKMGNIYTDMYEQDAIDYFGVANGLADQTDNAKVKGFVASSTATAYDKFGEPQEALKSYSKAVKHYTDASSPLKVAQNYAKASDVMLEYGNPAKAKGLLEKAMGFARQTDDVNLMNDLNKKLEQYV